ncbi:MAG TPA: queuosine precursor transporter, partial [Planctomycetota bacterium]|nr:queuosine precursor transporter [Planctomycetota bacterium]
ASWKIAGLGPFLMSIGIIPWPIVFLTTDLINEYFGRRGVRRLSFLTVGLIAYVFLVLSITMPIPAAEGISGVDDASYRRVFGQSQWIIVGSMTAFLVSQLIDVSIFHLLRKRTGKALLWLRATGSTIVSQLIDSVIVLYIGLAIPLGWGLDTFLRTASTNYVVKLAVAVGMTPLIYAGHWAVERYLGKSVAESLAEEAARDGPETAIPSTG